MNRKVVFESVVLVAFAVLVLTLVGLNAPPASACVPVADLGRCVNLQTISLPTPAPRPTPVVGGQTLTSAVDFPDTWQVIEPNMSVWFKTPYSDGYRIIELWVDTPAQNALGLSIFSPDQAAGAWWQENPVGRGTYNKTQPEHALTWKAGYAKAGVWYARLQNFTNLPVSYRLIGNLSQTDAKRCHGYWETINGTPIFWVDCGHYTIVPP